MPDPLGREVEHARDGNAREGVADEDHVTQVAFLQVRVYRGGTAG